MMERLKGLIREPAMLIEALGLFVTVIVSFGVGLSGDQQTYIVAAVVALLGLLKALLTRPFAVAFLTDFIRAGLVMAASFGVTLSADQIAQLSMLVGLVTTIVMRAQVTPSYDPVMNTTGSGSGPAGPPSTPDIPTE